MARPQNRSSTRVKASGRSTRAPSPSSSKGEFQALGRKSARRRSSQKGIAIIALLGGGVLVPLGMMIGFLDGYGQQDRTRKADAIVVLGAHVNQNGTAGHGLQTRALHALRLYKKGVAPNIICTGGVGDNPPAEAEAAAKLLLGKGVARNVIMLENKSTSTWENAAFTARICKSKKWKRVVVVSDPFHLWRAERNFAQNGVLAFGSPVAREQWKMQPFRKLFWTAREAILVVRDWCLRRV